MDVVVVRESPLQSKRLVPAVLVCAGSLLLAVRQIGLVPSLVVLGCTVGVVVGLGRTTTWLSARIRQRSDQAVGSLLAAPATAGGRNGTVRIFSDRIEFVPRDGATETYRKRDLEVARLVPFNSYIIVTRLYLSSGDSVQFDATVTSKGDRLAEALSMT